MNAWGFYGISDEVNKDYKQKRVNLRVKSNADAATQGQLGMYSPVYEVISRSVSVDFTLTIL